LERTGGNSPRWLASRVYSPHLASNIHASPCSPLMTMLKLLRTDPRLGASAAVFSALAHEHCVWMKAVLQLAQPLLGRFLLHCHSGSPPSLKYLYAIENCLDTHKTQRWFEVSPPGRACSPSR
jgi:hypothetical protein